MLDGEKKLINNLSYIKPKKIFVSIDGPVNNFDKLKIRSVRNLVKKSNKVCVSYGEVRIDSIRLCLRACELLVFKVQPGTLVVKLDFRTFLMEILYETS